jgi:queuine tRNA-ribosyltransferase
LNRLVDLEFPGYAIGGLSVGEPKPVMLSVVAESTRRMPAEKPRYLMGVGTPLDLVESIALGVDMFDCVMPRAMLAMDGFHFFRPHRDQNARFARDETVDEACQCGVCRSYSRAYLRICSSRTRFFRRC